MNLTPIVSTAEPDYPTYHPISPAWKRTAAALAASAALWLPACGEDATRLGGEPPPPIEQVRLAGEEPATRPMQVEHKPPELTQPPVLPEPPPPPRLSGTSPRPTPPRVNPPPPIEPPDPRVAGGRSAPRHPKHDGR